MLDLNEISPYIRLATYSKIKGPFSISKRIIFDYEILFIEDGNCSLIYKDKEYQLKKNDILLLLPNEQHEINIPDNIILSQPHIHFDVTYDEYSKYIPVSFSDRPQIPENEYKWIRNNYFAQCEYNPPFLHVSDIEQFKKLLVDVIEAYNSSVPLGILNARRRLMRLLGYIISENFSQSIVDTSKTQPLNLQVIRDYIDSNSEKKLTLSSIATLFHFNPSYLDRKFKEMFGSSVYKYYNFRKNEHAKNMLENGLQVTATANALSFSNIFEFSRFFKKMNGVYPSEYKNESKKIIKNIEQ